jgi:hypothetical protein
MKKIIVLRSENEALRMRALLEEQNIPFVIRSFHDSAYANLYQSDHGWGRLDAPEQDEQEVLRLYNQTIPLEEEKPLKSLYTYEDENFQLSDKPFLYTIIALIMILLMLVTVQR